MKTRTLDHVRDRWRELCGTPPSPSFTIEIQADELANLIDDFNDARELERMALKLLCEALDEAPLPTDFAPRLAEYLRRSNERAVPTGRRHE